MASDKAFEARADDQAAGFDSRPSFIADIVRQVRVEAPERFQLADHDPAGKLGLAIDKDAGRDVLADLVKDIARKQELLYAEGRQAVLVILQAMDAGGKDGTIERVFSGINPQGCQVHSFKTPSAEELAHDFLWRTTLRLPQRGHIGVFNRSYYEEVLVVRVHPDWLARQGLPEEHVDDAFWEKRFQSIRAFEQHLVRNGTRVLKFHLRLSLEEQRQRFLDRIRQPEKRWKFSLGDIAERGLWDRYMHAYEKAIRATSTPEAPWHVIPADRKWLAATAVAAVLLDALVQLDPTPPAIPEAEREAFARAEQMLQAEGPDAPKAPKNKHNNGG
ncbi:MAG TPA: PPK2 family polyphosphate kinase [Pseudolabrys sp.]|nr:PPK2 family polyphosphate kinase [Pseudolabrys sp.]